METINDDICSARREQWLRRVLVGLAYQYGVFVCPRRCCTRVAGYSNRSLDEYSPSDKHRRQSRAATTTGCGMAVRYWPTRRPWWDSPWSAFRWNFHSIRYSFAILSLVGGVPLERCWPRCFFLSFLLAASG